MPKICRDATRERARPPLQTILMAVMSLSESRRRGWKLGRLFSFILVGEFIVWQCYRDAPVQCIYLPAACRASYAATYASISVRETHWLRKFVRKFEGGITVSIGFQKIVVERP